MYQSPLKISLSNGRPLRVPVLLTSFTQSAIKLLVLLTETLLILEMGINIIRTPYQFI
jgi:hypothetical protein